MERSNNGFQKYPRYPKSQSKSHFAKSKKATNHNPKQSYQVLHSSSGISDQRNERPDGNLPVQMNKPSHYERRSSDIEYSQYVYCRYPNYPPIYTVPKEHNIRPSFQNLDGASTSRNENPLPLSSSEASITSMSGTVIDGKYVRKESIKMSLNASAEPFVPRTSYFNQGGSGSRSNNSTGTRSKYEDRHSKESLRGAKVSGSQTYHPKGGHFIRNSQQPMKSKQPSRFMNRQNLLVDKEFTAAIGENEVDADSDVAENEMPKIKDMIISKSKDMNIPKSKESITQREKLTILLEKGESECLVCYEPVRVRNCVWSCTNCYHVFHLHCIKKWARHPSSLNEFGWRCPTCQTVRELVPNSYYCFCGKQKDPEVNFHYTPHSCGEMCKKQRDDKRCIHPCNILCHPGPCPPCTASISRSCSCGKSKMVVTCAKSQPFTCSMPCEKRLNCDVHVCKDNCHIGGCKPCDVTMIQKCFCGNNERTVLCQLGNVPLSNYSCENTCGKKLDCGNHACTEICHPGPCGMCCLLPTFVTTCPCGKMALKDMESSGALRKSCTDPIPVCKDKCSIVLLCGPKDNRHKCDSNCHPGECPPCKLTTMVKCRCGGTSKEVSCADMTKSTFVFTCERRCNKRKDCGRHKCLNTCCVQSVHKCELVCNKKLTCGLHLCQETCHMGNCPKCFNVSFDELQCLCGNTVLYPPIACGTRPPECNQPCSRHHPCEHTMQHKCHSEAKCPPCTVLTVKWCFGHHERRSNVQCFLDGQSCGRPCQKPLPCGRHTCQETCHSGECLKPDTACTQPCLTLRSCEHPCAAPCHDGPCPDTMCRAKVEVSCPCGLRRETSSCQEDISAYRMYSASMMASKMQDIKAGESVNLNDIFGKKSKNNRLQCNEECAITERNKRLAVALQIQNPDLSCKPGPPNYSEFLKEEGRKNLKFVNNVYEKIAELVQLAKQSKQKSRSYAFPSMKRDQRRVVHELAEFFGCETQSYDEEPVKNVVVTAFREKSYLPFVSIVTIVERDKGLRRGPTPIVSCISKPPEEKKDKVIDYFDFDG